MFLCMSQLSTVQQNAGCYAIDHTGPSMRPESLPNPIAPSLSTFTNGVSPMQTPKVFNLSTPARSMDCLPDTLHVQNSNSMRLMHGLNGGIVKSESGYPSDPTIFYDADPNLGEAHGTPAVRKVEAVVILTGPPREGRAITAGSATV